MKRRGDAWKAQIGIVSVFFSPPTLKSAFQFYAPPSYHLCLPVVFQQASLFFSPHRPERILQHVRCCCSLSNELSATAVTTTSPRYHQRFCRWWRPPPCSPPSPPSFPVSPPARLVLKASHTQAYARGGPAASAGRGRREILVVEWMRSL